MDSIFVYHPHTAIDRFYKENAQDLIIGIPHSIALVKTQFDSNLEFEYLLLVMNVKSKELQDLVNISAMKFSALLVKDFHYLFPSLHFARFTISMQFKDQIVFFLKIFSVRYFNASSSEGSSVFLINRAMMQFSSFKYIVHYRPILC